MTNQKQKEDWEAPLEVISEEQTDGWDGLHVLDSSYLWSNKN